MKVKSKKQKLKEKIRRNSVPADEVFSKYKTDPEHRRKIDEKIRYYRLVSELYETRKKLKLTQQALAERSGIPRTTIAKIESGRRNVTLEKVMVLAEAMGKKADITLS